MSPAYVVTDNGIFNSSISIDFTYISTTRNYSSVEAEAKPITVINIIQSVLACVGIIGNCTVVIALVNNKKFRTKIPNIFIINQVNCIFNKNLDCDGHRLDSKILKKEVQLVKNLKNKRFNW